MGQIARTSHGSARRQIHQPLSCPHSINFTTGLKGYYRLAWAPVLPDNVAGPRLTPYRYRLRPITARGLGHVMSRQRLTSQ